eukprot:gene10896-2971_t
MDRQFDSTSSSVSHENDLTNSEQLELFTVTEWLLFKATAAYLKEENDSPWYNAAKEAYNSLKNKDQLLTRWRFAKILHAVFEQPQELPSVFDDFSSVVPDEEDKGPDSEYLACATELRIHFVLNAYSYGKWVHEPEKVAGFANLFDGLPEHSNYDNDLYNANNKTWKQFTLTWLEKIRIKPEQKGACQYLEYHTREEFQHHIATFLEPYHANLGEPGLNLLMSHGLSGLCKTYATSNQQTQPGNNLITLSNLTAALTTLEQENNVMNVFQSLQPDTRSKLQPAYFSTHSVPVSQQEDTNAQRSTGEKQGGVLSSPSEILEEHQHRPAQKSDSKHYQRKASNSVTSGRDDAFDEDSEEEEEEEEEEERDQGEQRRTIFDVSDRSKSRKAVPDHHSSSFEEDDLDTQLAAVAENRSPNVGSANNAKRDTSNKQQKDSISEQDPSTIAKTLSSKSRNLMYGSVMRPNLYAVLSKFDFAINYFETSLPSCSANRRTGTDPIDEFHKHHPSKTSTRHHSVCPPLARFLRTLDI